VPLTTCEAWVRGLSGITIPDVEVRLFVGEGEAPAEPDQAQQELRPPKRGKPLDRRRGSLLFTHFGLSGPVILDISRSFTALPSGTMSRLCCDFLPQMPTEQIETELRQAAAADGKRLVVNWLAEHLPRRLVEALFVVAGVPAETRAAEFSKQARAALIAAVKMAEIPITGTRGFAKAEVTAGGVSLSEIDSRTMESKLVPGLYFAGEILDLDGPIGGYNFQAAFSTGVLAGQSV
jgi:predicted Rossmann fold flavoprotein